MIVPGPVRVMSSLSLTDNTAVPSIRGSTRHNICAASL